jgi:hypothetical protein
LEATNLRFIQITFGWSAQTIISRRERFVRGALGTTEGRPPADCASILLASEATAIILWRHTIGFNECATHALVIAKTGPTRDDLDWIVCRFEKASGRFCSELLNSPCGAFSGLAKIDTSEIARAHPSHFRQCLDGQVCFEIVPNPIMKVLEPAARIAHLLTQFDAELRLAARSLEKKNHPTGYVERCEMAQIVLNHR